MNTSYCLFQGI